MDDVLTFADENPQAGAEGGSPWKILIADDEPSVHLVTKLALGDFSLEGRRLQLLSAYGEEDTRRLLTEHPDIALILLDVVMDTIDSGFTLVRFIRDTLKNKDVRIIMRTGQSGNAPEDRIIIDYDINDFKDKTELTVAKLRTTLISSLRTFSHLKIIAEEQRKSSSNRTYLHTIIDSLTSVLITLSLDREVLLWNREAERWTGISAEKAAGRNLFEIAPVFGPLRALFHQLVSQGTSGLQRIEHASVPLWKGEQVFVHLILQTLEGSNGPEILFRLDDRTLAKQQDDLLLRSQKVSAFSSLAQVLPQSESELNASGLLQRLVRFSPVPVTDRTALDWAELVKVRLKPWTAKQGITVSFQSFPKKAWVVAHGKGLEVVVDSLLENAYEAMTSMPGAAELSGPKTVDLVLDQWEMGDTERLKHPDLSATHFWRLSIQDHGVGMLPEVIHQVFDPYFTTKTHGQGLGLGLPLVHSLAEDWGGFLNLFSQPGLGTLVQVFLPVWKETKGTHDRPSEGAILLCDDEPLMRQVAGKVLRNHGYQVLEAEDGTVALDLFQAQSHQIRLVILDVVLPGISGLEVFRKIHAQRPDLPVLLSSGFGRGDGIDQALEEGVAGFLQKPYRAEGLVEAVRRLLSPQTSG